MIGVHLQLFDESTQQASLPNIQAMWWDVTEPKDGYRPVGKTSLAVTDSSGYIDLDLSNVTGLSIGDYGFLMLYKLDATDHEDSLVFAGKVQTSDITSGVDMYYYDSGWTRPYDWPDLDAITDGVQKIQGLYAVYDIETEGNGVAFACAGAYHVDWGDGTNEDVATGVTAQHVYDYADADLGAATSEGFKCAVITITPQSGQNLTSVNFQKRHTNFTQVCTASWLDIAINGSLITTLTLSASTPTVRLGSLYQFAMGQNGVTNATSCFNSCYSLKIIHIFGIKITFTIADCSLGPEALNELYSNLGTGVTATLTVTGNWGVSSDNTDLKPAGWTVVG